MQAGSAGRRRATSSRPPESCPAPHHAVEAVVKGGGSSLRAAARRRGPHVRRQPRHQHLLAPGQQLAHAGGAQVQLLDGGRWRRPRGARLARRIQQRLGHLRQVGRVGRHGLLDGSGCCCRHSARQACIAATTRAARPGAVERLHPLRQQLIDATHLLHQHRVVPLKGCVNIHVCTTTQAVAKTARVRGWQAHERAWGCMPGLHPGLAPGPVQLASPNHHDPHAALPCLAACTHPHATQPPPPRRPPLSIGPILLAAMKPMPPQHSRQSLRMRLRCQVDPALSPLDTTCTCLPASGPPCAPRQAAAARHMVEVRAGSCGSQPQQQ